MALWQKLPFWQSEPELPEHLKRGNLGETAARAHLEKCGLKFLTANFTHGKAEIDLIFRDGDCLIFVEVKTRSSELWTRPSKAVDAHKKRMLTKAALQYLRLLKNPKVPFRFDIVEVLVDGDNVRQIRHLKNCFNLSAPYQYY